MDQGKPSFFNHLEFSLARLFLHHTDIQISTAAARAIHDDESIAAALPALAECLDTTKHSNDAFLRRSLNANYRLGSEESAERLVQFALSQKHSIELRREALVCLFSWDMPPVLDRVEGIHRPILTSRSALDKNKNVQTLLAQAEPEFQVCVLSARIVFQSGFSLLLFPVPVVA